MASYLVVLTVSVASFSRKDLSLSETSTFERMVIDSLAPLQRSVSYLHGRMGDIVDHYISNVEAAKNNASLRKEVKRLKRRIHEFLEIERENQRLKEFLAFGQQNHYREVLAQIVAWDAASDFRAIRINKGLKSGIKLQSTVITADGLVGHIFRLTNNFADILTVLDHNNRVDSIIQRIRAHGIVEGHSKDICTMKYVTRTEPVILNDLVITSGLGNIYPKGLVVGSVSKIERESYGITQKIEVRPAVDFSRLEEVVVLVNEGDFSREQEFNALNALEYGGQND